MISLRDRNYIISYENQALDGLLCISENQDVIPFDTEKDEVTVRATMEIAHDKTVVRNGSDD